VYFRAGLASGVARGTGSLIGGTLDGGLGVVSSVTAGVGGAVAALSMDQAYTTKRAFARAAEQNARRGGAAGGIARTPFADSVARRSRVAAEMVRGAHDLGSGIFDGVTGIVVEPYLCRSVLSFSSPISLRLRSFGMIL
jgi:hypothetical protein